MDICWANQAMEGMVSKRKARWVYSQQQEILILRLFNQVLMKKSTVITLNGWIQAQQIKTGQKQKTVKPIATKWT